MDSEEQTTGTTDDNYNLISTLYHMLEGAETYELYAEDAEEADDDELAGYFREVQNTNRQLAERAKELLKQRLS
jgi:rubrerythrin